MTESIRNARRIAHYGRFWDYRQLPHRLIPMLLLPCLMLAGSLAVADDKPPKRQGSSRS